MKSKCFPIHLPFIYRDIRVLPASLFASSLFTSIRASNFSWQKVAEEVGEVKLLDAGWIGSLVTWKFWQNGLK
jgi:hypothetical protein